MLLHNLLNSMEKQVTDMNHTDSMCITSLFFLLMMTICVVYWTDSEIDAMNKTINHLITQQAVESGRIDQLIVDNTEQDSRLDDLEYHDQIQDIRLRMHRDELTNTADLFTDLLEDVGELEEALKHLPKSKLPVKVTEKDIRDIAALVYLEAGGQSYRCQKAIASVIFKRMIRYKKSAQAVIYESGVFSPASRVPRTIPSRSCMKAVKDVLANGTSLPRSVVAFRSGHYHSFGHAYCCVDGVYFSSVG